ncbi:MAG: hypothetical protein JNJ70_12925 [Verrucomicrobiales bacterium]|nr:hypothetical protein [Verrucomicrobiales bacterium]
MATAPALITSDQILNQWHWLRGELDRTEKMLEALGVPIPDSAIGGVQLPGQRAQSPGRFSGVTVARAMGAIIAENGPLEFRDIHRIYVEGGGDKEKASLQSILSRSSSFELRDDKWHLVDDEHL